MICTEIGEAIGELCSAVANYEDVAIIADKSERLLTVVGTSNDLIKDMATSKKEKQ
jgi:hypothetical protein